MHFLYIVSGPFLTEPYLITFRHHIAITLACVQSHIFCCAFIGLTKQVFITWKKVVFWDSEEHGGTGGELGIGRVKYPIVSARFEEQTVMKTQDLKNIERFSCMSDLSLSY